ncbi:hypothetical protein ABT187_14520 [Streptomyces sp. NPDC001817]|uniref:hypothetical protein n=1 Tax=Streptomyces sp. NPDC001817 TaxID=3154398 RepID=UPI003328A054
MLTIGLGAMVGRVMGDSGAAQRNPPSADQDNGRPAAPANTDPPRRTNADPSDGPDRAPSGAATPRSTVTGPRP